jgi:hypothetical protein
VPLNVMLGSHRRREARSIDPAAETDRKVRRRCWRAKGCVEKRASTGMEKADAHRSIDPLPAKTGSGEQRASRHTITGCRVSAVHAGRETSWSTGHLEPFFFFPPFTSCVEIAREFCGRAPLAYARGSEPHRNPDH